MSRKMECKAQAHGASNNAWRLGCRHAPAVAAHRAWLAKNKPFELRPPAVDAGGNCVAPKHKTRQAFIMGCRCPEAIVAQDKYLARKNDSDRIRRSREYTRQYESAWRRTTRRTGGRFNRDPRGPWRGGKMVVDRNNLCLLLAGHPDSPTLGEMVAAVARVQEARVPDSPWTSRPIDNIEISERLRMKSDRQVYRLRKTRERLRSERTRRRLADVRWKEAVAAEAPGRRERERLVHEVGHARNEARELAWKWHCRTQRRLRESQQRAKVVALAIQRRALTGRPV